MKRSNWPTTSRHARGYGGEWDKTRIRILKRDHGLCQCAECQGGKLRVRTANEVHHIVSRAEAKRRGWSAEQTEADSNLQAINHDCHERETAAEQGRKLKPRVEIGDDGWPTRIER